MPLPSLGLRKLLYVSLALALGVPAAAAGGGGSGYSEYYLTSVERGRPAPTIQVWMRLDATSFAVNSVEKQYKLLPLVLENSTDKPITLSAAQDRVTVVTNSDESISASIQIAKLDRPLWDSWDSRTHNKIEYPQSVEPHQSRVIYVFVPRGELAELPRQVDFTIASLGLTLTLRELGAMAD
jgi:hypothetical protein